MQITTRNIDLRVDDSLMRVYIAAPKPSGIYPGLIFYSDIYQLGSPMTRLANYLAGYGYVVAAPEIFHRIEPIGQVIEPDDLGRMRGNDNARRTPVEDYDRDGRALIEFLKGEESVAADKIGTLGFCIGGHLAFRTAFESEIKAAVCCYPTGLTIGKLGQGVADTIQRVQEIQGETLIVLGSQDRHTPENDRQTIKIALEKANIAHKIVTYEAQHTFMRDDGYRYDPVATTAAWSEIVVFLERVFAS